MCLPPQYTSSHGIHLAYRLYFHFISSLHRRCNDDPIAVTEQPLSPNQVRRRRHAQGVQHWHCDNDFRGHGGNRPLFRMRVLHCSCAVVSQAARQALPPSGNSGYKHITRVRLSFESELKAVMCACASLLRALGCWCVACGALYSSPVGTRTDDDADVPFIVPFVVSFIVSFRC